MKGIRIGICVLAGFAVLAFGTVEIWSEGVLEIGAAVLLLWWALLTFFRRGVQIRWTAIFWPVLVFIGIVGFQLILRISVYPFLTRVGLLKFVACAVLFFLAVQAFQTRDDLKILAWFLLSFGFAVAVFGIVQNYTSHALLYWLRPLTGGGNPFGPYVDRDHFAGLMEVIAPVGMSMIALRGVRREQVGFVGILTLLPVAALFLSASRGGVAAFVFEVALLFALAWRKGGRGAVALAGMLLVAVAFVAWLGAGTVLQRVRSSSIGELSAGKRASMLIGAWHIFLNYPAAGTGLGTFVAIYPKYDSSYDGRIVDHVHNDYAELLAETGIAGGLCGAVFLVMLFGTAKQRLSQEQSGFSRSVHAAGTVACAGLLVHSFVDFNLHIPANGLFFLLAAVLVLSPVFHRRKQILIT